MLVKLYLIVFAITAIITIIRPILGIYSAVFLLLCNPSFFFPEEVEAFRPTVVLWVILFFSTLFRGFSIKQASAKFTIFAVLFVLFSIISFLLAGEVEVYKSIPCANYFKAGLVGFILVGFLSEEKQLLNLIRVSVLGGACNAVFGIAEQFYQIPERLAESPGYYRSGGFDGNANYYSAIIISILPLAYYMYTHEKKKYLRYCGLITIFLIIPGVFCSISRGGLAVLTVVLGLIFIKNIKKISVLLLIVIFAGSFLYFAKELYLKRETVKTTRSGVTKFDPSTSMRIDLVKTSLNLWLYNPIFGVGPGQFVAQAKEQLKVAKSKVSRSVHNAYLHLLVENGLIGFSFFFGIFILSFKAIIRMKLKMGFYSEMAASFQICLISWLVSFWGGTQQGLAFVWVCLAFPLILDKIYSLHEQQENKPGGTLLASRV
jgi:O-antigen ligase